MTPDALLVAACLATAVGWSFRGWWRSQRVRARVTAASRPEGGAADVSVRPGFRPQPWSPAWLAPQLRFSSWGRSSWSSWCSAWPSRPCSPATGVAPGL